MTDRWFLLPIATGDSGGRYAKYTRKDGVNGFSGNIYDTTDVSVAPDGEYYIVRINAPTDVLDSIENENDAETMDTLGLSKKEIVAIFNDEFDQQRSFDEWKQSFKVGGG